MEHWDQGSTLVVREDEFDVVNLIRVDSTRTSLVYYFHVVLTANGGNTKSVYLGRLKVDYKQDCILIDYTSESV